jgi:hypothetical protein
MPQEQNVPECWRRSQKTKRLMTRVKRQVAQQVIVQESLAHAK